MRDDRVWEERVEIMTEEWKQAGWYVKSISTLRLQNAYKMQIDYEKLDSEAGERDGFSEFVWRDSNATWKATGTMVTPYYGWKYAYFTWWLRQESRTVTELAGSLKRAVSVEETDQSAPAGSSDQGMEGTTALQPAIEGEEVPSEEVSSSGSEIIAPTKRMRCAQKSPP